MNDLPSTEIDLYEEMLECLCNSQEAGDTLAEQIANNSDNPDTIPDTIWDFVEALQMGGIMPATDDHNHDLQVAIAMSYAFQTLFLKEAERQQARQSLESNLSL